MISTFHEDRESVNIKAIEIINVARQFLVDTELNKPNATHIDFTILTEVSKNYYRSESKYITYNENITCGIDGFKKAAIFTYWISKLRPISILDPFLYNVDGAEYVNELFSIYYSAREIPNYLQKWSDEYVDTLLYTLKNRRVTIDNLFLTFKSLE